MREDSRALEDSDFLLERLLDEMDQPEMLIKTRLEKSQVHSLRQGISQQAEAREAYQLATHQS